MSGGRTSHSASGRTADRILAGMDAIIQKARGRTSSGVSLLKPHYRRLSVRVH